MMLLRRRNYSRVITGTDKNMAEPWASSTVRSTFFLSHQMGQREGGQLWLWKPRNTFYPRWGPLVRPVILRVSLRQGKGEESLIG